jgi:hypothetical protein
MEGDLSGREGPAAGLVAEVKQEGRGRKGPEPVVVLEGDLLESTLEHR